MHPSNQPILPVKRLHPHQDQIHSFPVSQIRDVYQGLFPFLQQLQPPVSNMILDCPPETLVWDLLNYWEYLLCVDRVRELNQKLQCFTEST